MDWRSGWILLNARESTRAWRGCQDHPCFWAMEVSYRTFQFELELEVGFLWFRFGVTLLLMLEDLSDMVRKWSAGLLRDGCIKVGGADLVGGKAK